MNKDLMMALFALCCHELTQRFVVESSQHVSMRTRLRKQHAHCCCFGDLGYVRNKTTPPSRCLVIKHEQVGRCAQNAYSTLHTSHHETTQPCKWQNPRDTCLRGTGAKSSCSAYSTTSPLLVRYALRVDCKPAGSVSAVGVGRIPGSIREDFE